MENLRRVTLLVEDHPPGIIEEDKGAEGERTVQLCDLLGAESSVCKTRLIWCQARWTY